jgi:hypothetical protein
MPLRKKDSSAPDAIGHADSPEAHLVVDQCRRHQMAEKDSMVGQCRLQNK